MTMSLDGTAMLISLPEATVARLLAVRTSDLESISDVVDRMLAAREPAKPKELACEETFGAVSSLQGKYSCEVLGSALQASTLPVLFGAVIDLVNEIDPAALKKFSHDRARKRTFVALDKRAIHPGRPDLGVILTASGWWISSNVGAKDIDRALRALAKTTGLVFGKDIRFPA